MTRTHRCIAAGVALTLGALAAERADAFLARERCLEDWGGRHYFEDPDVCELATGAEAALPPRDREWWGAIAVPGLMAAGVGYGVVTWVLTRLSRAAA